MELILASPATHGTPSGGHIGRRLYISAPEHSVFDSETNSGVCWLRDYQIQTNPVSTTVSVRAKADPVEMRSLQEQIVAFADFCGLSKSDLAKAFGVSRPTIYAWISGASEPQDANAVRIRTLYRLLVQTAWDGKRPLYHGYIGTLRDELLRTELNESHLSELMKLIWKQTRDRDARIAGVPVRDPSLTDDRNLLDNLMALGTEG
jgi:DNA-binding transcriptional regulator YiaG